MKKYIAVFVACSLIITLGVLVVPVSALPNLTATATPFICVPTATPTSIFGGVVFPTVNFNTPQATNTPGTITPTVTGTPPTATPTGTPGAPDCGDDLYLYGYLTDVYSNSGLANNTDISEVTCFQPTPSTIYCTGTIGAANNTPENYPAYPYLVVTFQTTPGRTVYIDMVSTGNTANGDFFGRCGLFGGCSLITNSNPMIGYTSWTTGNDGANNTHSLNINTVVGMSQSHSISFYLVISLGIPCLATPMPATATPSACIPPGEVIDTDIIVFQSPVITPGECYTLLPDLSIDLPSLTWSPFELPESIGIPGVFLCVDTITAQVKLFSFDVMAILAGIMLVVSASVVWKQINS